MSKRYVDADYILEQIYNAQESLETNDDKLWSRNKPYFKGLAWANAIISEAPVVNVEEVRHGEWLECTRKTIIPVEYDSNGDLILHEVVEYRCSLCDRLCGKKEPYCHCGAKMDGGKK
jgi:hypothetical protein